MDNSHPLPPADVVKATVKSAWYEHPTIRILIKGIIISLPILIIILIISMIFKLIFSFVEPISYVITPGAEEPHWMVDVISLAILLGLFYMVGMLHRHHSGKYYFRYVEKEYLRHIPLYTTVRDLVQQFAGLKQMPFSQVVLIDVFNSGTLMTGFITEQVSENIYTVFVPTAPNPTNGNIYHVPASRLQFIDVKPDSAMRTIVGMGTGSSCLFGKESINKLRALNKNAQSNKN